MIPMKNTKIALFALLALSLSACTSYRHTARVTQIDGQPIVANQTVVDVRCDFNKRVVAESRWARTIEEAMQEANYNAIVNNNIDIVVSPIYSIQIRKRHKIKASLTGLAGYYENARTVTTKEMVQELSDVDRKDIEKYLLLYQSQQTMPYLYPMPVLQDGQTQSIVINADGHAHPTVDPAVTPAQPAAPTQPAAPAPPAPAKKKGKK